MTTRENYQKHYDNIVNRTIELLKELGTNIYIQGRTTPLSIKSHNNDIYKVTGCIVKDGKLYLTTSDNTTVDIYIFNIDVVRWLNDSIFIDHVLNKKQVKH